MLNPESILNRCLLTKLTGQPQDGDRHCVQYHSPNAGILRMADGKNQHRKIPKDQRFMINGQHTDAFGLQKGMQISATAVTDVPETVITQQIKRTGQAPPPPPSAISYYCDPNHHCACSSTSSTTSRETDSRATA
jgi:hypothetical protein